MVKLRWHSLLLELVSSVHFGFSLWWLLTFDNSTTGQDWAQFAEDEEIILPEGTGGRAFIDNWKRLAPEFSKWFFFLLGLMSLLFGF